jgi:signal transduction histidine kinase
MTSPHSLADRLARQWVLFALGLCAILLAGSVLLLYLLEDSFIDRRLHEQAQLLDAAHHAVPPSAGFTVYRAEALPAELRARVGDLRSGRIVEFRRADGRYVHLRRGELPSGAPYWLVYDVSDQLDVNAGLRLLGPWVLGLCLVVALLAWALARLFVRRSVRRVGALLGELQGVDDPDALRRRAEAEPVDELRQLSLLLAEAWDARLAALRTERETLAFLAHELRTPLQSLKNGLALLGDQAADDPVLARLQRAAGRLQRASASVLWLASEADATTQRCAPAGIAHAVIAELHPLAARRGQRFAVAIDERIDWPGPAEALEAAPGPSACGLRSRCWWSKTRPARWPGRAVTASGWSWRHD